MFRKFLLKLKALNTEIYTLYLAYRDPRVKWYVKVLLLAIVAYAVSPVDLIPDFIPVLGYVDDIIILPLGIFLVLRLIPPEVKEECRARARAEIKNGKLRALGLVMVVLFWLACLGIVLYILLHT